MNIEENQVHVQQMKIIKPPLELILAQYQLIR